MLMSVKSMFAIPLVFLLGALFSPFLLATDLTIKSAYWDAKEQKLRVSGSGTNNNTVNLYNSYILSKKLDDDKIEEGRWSLKSEKPNPIPCKIRVQTSPTNFVDKLVTNAPTNCFPKDSTVPTNKIPVAIISGPTTGAVNSNINFTGLGSYDSDGIIAKYTWDFGDGSNSNVQSPTHNYSAAGTFTITLVVTDNLGANSLLVSHSIKIEPAIVCNSTIPEHCSFSKYTGPEVCVECHKSEALDLHGSVHYQQGGEFPNVTNIPKTYKSAGERPAHALGELVATGINSYCGTHENSPRFTCAGCHIGNGRFPMAQTIFESLDPNSSEALKELANLDCLMCHQDVYKRFPNWTATGQGFSDFSLINLTEINGNLVKSIGDEVLRTGFKGIPNVSEDGDFLFNVAGKDNLPSEVPMIPMQISSLESAQLVHKTTRRTCLNCHATAAGGDGAKRGDLSKETINPTVKNDFHMSPNGADLTCSECHNAIGNNGESHRVRGRGLDLRANDVNERFTCTSGCHSTTPHGDFSNTNGSSKDKHAMKVACQTCHIPSYAKASVGTEVVRDWQNPIPTNSACNGRGGWLPADEKGFNLTPVYKWFDGTSKITYIGENINNIPTTKLTADIANFFIGDYTDQSITYILAEGNGNINSNNSKIYPMKEHWGKLGINNNTFVPHSTFEYFRTGSFCRALSVGLGLEPENLAVSSICTGDPGSLDTPPNTEVVSVVTYQTINHGVEEKNSALNCGSCHKSLTGGPIKVDMNSLGYNLRTLPSIINQGNLNGDINKICSQCHKNETKERDFTNVHKKHVGDKKKDCSACHNFSRPERNLSTTKS